MRELDTTFVLLIAATMFQPVSAEALQRNFTGAESSCAINGAWYGKRFEQLAGSDRISFVRMTTNNPIEHDSNQTGSASLLPLAKPQPFGPDTGMRHHYPTGLRTLVYDMNTAPLIDNRVNTDYSPNRGSASGDIWSTCRPCASPVSGYVLLLTVRHSFCQQRGCKGLVQARRDLSHSGTG